tara:strand:+ start:149 stop:1060 length:912 start_codon:yes stop_codon:yes gene_type:complete
MKLAGSLNHSNITDIEIKHYYSLRPVKSLEEAEDEYNFTKQLQKIIGEYTKTQTFSSDQAERNFKSRLKKFILDDKSSRGKIYDSFIYWRSAQIQCYRSKVRDLRIEESKTPDMLDYEKTIKDLKSKVTHLQNQCEIYKQENIELRSRLTNVEPVVEPVVEAVVEPVVEAVVIEPVVIEPVVEEPVVIEPVVIEPVVEESRTIVKSIIESIIDSVVIEPVVIDTKQHYLNKILSKENQLVELFEDKYQFNMNVCDSLKTEYLEFLDNECEILEGLGYEIDEDEDTMYNDPIENFKHRLESLAR